MEGSKKMVICSVLSLIFLIFIAGCSNHGQGNIIASGDTVTISEAELGSIKNCKTVILTDDSPACRLWIPKDEKITLNEITAWLKQAIPYKGEIPKDQTAGTFNANIAPSALHIITSDNHEITIQPAWYLAMIDGTAKAQCVTDILEVDSDKQKSYIQSGQLFNWLKNNKWNTEFEMKH